MSIQSYFQDNQSITYQEIIVFINSNDLDFKLREVASNEQWVVEAYYQTTLAGVTLLVVFNLDTLSPYKNYTQPQLEAIISSLQAHYNNVKELLN